MTTTTLRMGAPCLPPPDICVLLVNGLRPVKDGVYPMPAMKMNLETSGRPTTPQNGLISAGDPMIGSGGEQPNFGRDEGNSFDDAPVLTDMVKVDFNDPSRAWSDTSSSGTRQGIFLRVLRSPPNFSPTSESALLRDPDYRTGQPFQTALEDPYLSAYDFEPDDHFPELNVAPEDLDDAKPLQQAVQDGGGFEAFQRYADHRPLGGHLPPSNHPVNGYVIPPNTDCVFRNTSDRPMHLLSITPVELAGAVFDTVPGVHHEEVVDPVGHVVNHTPHIYNVEVAVNVSEQFAQPPEGHSAPGPARKGAGRPRIHTVHLLPGETLKKASIRQANSRHRVKKAASKKVKRDFIIDMLAAVVEAHDNMKPAKQHTIGAKIAEPTPTPPRLNKSNLYDTEKLENPENHSIPRVYEDLKELLIRQRSHQPGFRTAVSKASYVLGRPEERDDRRRDQGKAAQTRNRERDNEEMRMFDENIMEIENFVAMLHRDNENNKKIYQIMSKFNPS
ncbi:unnamed protein product, partial [Mesorhabditis spiculigera]